MAKLTEAQNPPTKDIDLDHFTEWLNKFGPDEVVGHTIKPCDCPVARYLHETEGGDWSIGVGWISKGDAEEYPTSETLATLIKKLDLSVGALDPVESPITKSMAMRCVEGLQRPQNRV